MAVISFRHGFIFIKTRKTAGTSIEADLCRILGKEDVATPIIPEVPGHRPQNFETGAGRFFNHMSAVQIREILGANTFEQLLKFCVEREPVSKTISYYHMLRNSPAHYRGDITWDEYCNAGDFPVDVEKYTEEVGGRRILLADRVLRFEKLDTEIRDLFLKIGVPDFRITSRAKAKYSRRRLVGPEHVTDAQRDLIRAAFKETSRVTGLYGTN
jgi:hypothetical protein